MLQKDRNSSDYSFKNWRAVKIFPDLIPVVGAVTWTERARREERLSVREFYLYHFSDPVSWLSMGTSEWPDPVDKKAAIRSGLLALRNVSFAMYHTLLPLVVYLNLANHQ